MPTLYVLVPTFGRPPVSYDFGVMYAVVADLRRAAGGVYTGAGGTEGYSVFGFRVADETAGRTALGQAMEKHAQGVEYHVRVAEDSGCSIPFEILREFVPKKLSLCRADGQPLGSFDQVQATISFVFPGSSFAWTPDGPTRLRRCEESGHPLTADLRERLASMTSELEGVAEGRGYRVTFGLGSQEPVQSLRVTPLGNIAELQSGLAALQSEVGAAFQALEQ
jgi:hypothetical protein